MKLAIIIPGFQSSADDWCIPAFTNLARELAKHAELHVFTLRYPGNRHDYRVGSVHVHALGGGAVAGVRLPAASLLKLWYDTFQALRREHQREPFACLVGIWATESGWLATRIAHRLGVPSLVHLAGGELTWLPRIRYGNQGRGLARLLVRQTIHRADLLAVPSTPVRRALLRFRSVRAESMRCLPLGVDSEMFTPRRESYSQPDKPFTFVSAGSLIPVKGYDWLLDGFAHLVRKSPNAKFRWRIAGTGPLFGELAGKVPQAGLTGNVDFLGEVRHDLMPDLYGTADCFLLGSHHEAQCMAALEAMACGLPWIAPPVGALVDCAKQAPGKVPSGILVESRTPEALAGVLSRVMSMPAEVFAVMGANARKKVEHDYRLETQAQRLLDVVAELTQGRAIDRISQAHT